MPARLRFDRSCLGLVGALLLAATPAMTASGGRALAQAAQPAQQAPAPALSVEQARAAAVRVMQTLQKGDAKARYAQFSPEMQAITSPAMIAATMRTQPKILSYDLLSVQSGINTSTVEVDVKTQAGQRVVFMVFDSNGRIERYYIDRNDDDTSKVALQFVEAISTGNFITAQSFLSPEFQKDITPQALQDKWLSLQRLTGAFVKVGRAVEAERTADSQLVLVNVQFNRLTDNLFVVLNNDNQITGIDFPELVAAESSVR
ncbi:MAG: DUF3887 domain-containing protein [Cyanobacteriota bacterium]|nr:DUF3887 domain-containing protein [Cyanobacteriota bacterium]